MKAPRSVVATGYVALDVVCHDASVRQVAGGTAANVAANLAFLGWESSLVARIGADTPGRRVAHDLEMAGVKCMGQFHDAAVETPVVVHRVTPPDHEFAFKCPSCERRSPRFKAVDGEELDANGVIVAAKPPNVVFADRMSGYALELFERYGDGSLRVVEPSARGTEALAGRMAEHADVLKWSHELNGELHGVMFESRPGQLQIETLGAEGLRFRVGNDEWAHIAAPAVDPVDTAGAGDWLTAGFLDTLPSLDLRKLSAAQVHAALDAAQGLAALSCLYVGARSLASLSSEVVKSAAETLRRGALESAVPLTLPGRRSRAAGVCETCLGSLA